MIFLVINAKFYILQAQEYGVRYFMKESCTVRNSAGPLAAPV